MRARKVDFNEATKIILNKMLEKHNITIADIKEKADADGKIEGVSWFEHYTRTEEEYNEWKLWALDFLNTKVKPKYTKKYLEIQFNMIDLMWGLKII